MSRLLLAAAFVIGGCADRVVDAVLAGLDGGGVVRRSCQEILNAAPESRDGTYLIDPDGPGGRPPFEVFCDMTTKEGGWTRLAQDDFSSPPRGFSKNTVTTCGEWGSLLGGYRTFGNETITTTVDLRQVPHSEVRVRFDLVVIDSWDGERVFVELDGVRVWSRLCEKSVPATCGQMADYCGWDGKDRNDGKVPVDLTAIHQRPELAVAIGAVLDQSLGDESWGIDDFSVLVR